MDEERDLPERARHWPEENFAGLFQVVSDLTEQFRNIECCPQENGCPPMTFDPLWRSPDESPLAGQSYVVPPRELAQVAYRDPATPSVGDELLRFAAGRKFGTILADPPWQFTNRTGKMAPEHKRLSRYGTLSLGDIAALPVAKLAAEPAHLYLWVPNALLPEGLLVMKAWGFNYKSNIVWHKVRKDGGSDGRGVGFYFRNVTELILFGVRGKNARTREAGRRQVNLLATRKREHSRKPDEQYRLIEECSRGPFIELFARGARSNWANWGNQADERYEPTWKTYAHNSRGTRKSERELKSFD
jgi:N6-adenosine-specific RNA methylase IME4